SDVCSSDLCRCHARGKPRGHHQLQQPGPGADRPGGNRVALAAARAGPGGRQARKRSGGVPAWSRPAQGIRTMTMTMPLRIVLPLLLALLAGCNPFSTRSNPVVAYSPVVDVTVPPQ